MFLGETRFLESTQYHARVLSPAVLTAGPAQSGWGFLFGLFSFFLQTWLFKKKPVRNWTISRESTASDGASFPSKHKISGASSCMFLQACTRAPSAPSPGGTCVSLCFLVTRDRPNLVSLSPSYLAYSKKRQSTSCCSDFLSIIAIKYLYP